MALTVRLSAKAIGLNEAKAALRGLPKRIRNRAVRNGLRRIGSQLSKKIKARLPTTRVGKRGRIVATGQTKKSIGLKIKIYRTSGNVALVVGPRSGFKVKVAGGALQTIRKVKGADVAGKTRTVKRANAARKARYHNPTQTFHLIDRGTKKLPARNYLRNALSEVIPLAPGIMAEEVRKALATHASLNSE